MKNQKIVLAIVICAVFYYTTIHTSSGGQGEYSTTDATIDELRKERNQLRSALKHEKEKNKAQSAEFQKNLAACEKSLASCNETIEKLSKEIAAQEKLLKAYEQETNLLTKRNRDTSQDLAKTERLLKEASNDYDKLQRKVYLLEGLQKPLVPKAPKDQ